MFAGYSKEYVPVHFTLIRGPNGTIEHFCSGDGCSNMYPNVTSKINNVVEDGVYTVSAVISSSNPPVFSSAMSYYITVSVTPAPEMFGK